jgi:hypothetical protein
MKFLTIFAILSLISCAANTPLPVEHAPVVELDYNDYVAEIENTITKIDKKNIMYDADDILVESALMKMDIKINKMYTLPVLTHRIIARNSSDFPKCVDLKVGIYDFYLTPTAPLPFVLEPGQMRNVALLKEELLTYQKFTFRTGQSYAQILEITVEDGVCD